MGSSFRVTRSMLYVGGHSQCSPCSSFTWVLLRRLICVWLAKPAPHRGVGGPRLEQFGWLPLLSVEVRPRPPQPDRSVSCTRIGSQRCLRCRLWRGSRDTGQDDERLPIGVGCRELCVCLYPFATGVESPPPGPGGKRSNQLAALIGS